MSSTSSMHLEAQQQERWCWAACARMLSMKYMQSYISQASAAVFVKQGIEELYPLEEQISASTVNGGTPLETENAVEYILGCGNYDICHSAYEIYSEEILRSRRREGHIPTAMPAIRWEMRAGI